MIRTANNYYNTTVTNVIQNFENVFDPVLVYFGRSLQPLTAFLIDFPHLLPVLGSMFLQLLIAFTLYRSSCAGELLKKIYYVCSLITK